MENTLEDAESKKGRMVIRFVGVIFSDAFRDGLKALNQIKPRGGWGSTDVVFYTRVSLVVLDNTENRPPIR